MAELNEELIKEYQECFSILDKDNDNMLTREEIKQVIKGVQPPMDDEEINAFMEAGGIGQKADEPTFRKAMTKKMTLVNTKDEIIEAFKTFDTDGTGKIGRAELSQMFKVLGDGLISEEHLEVFFKKCFSKDNPDVMDYNEWLGRVEKETFPPGA